MPNSQARKPPGALVRVDDDTYALLVQIAEKEDRTLISVLRAAVAQLATAKNLKVSA